MNKIDMLLQSIKWNRSQAELHPDKQQIYNHRKSLDLVDLGSEVAEYNRTHNQKLNMKFEDGMIVGVELVL